LLLIFRSESSVESEHYQANKVPKFLQSASAHERAHRKWLFMTQRREEIKNNNNNDHLSLDKIKFEDSVSDSDKYDFENIDNSNFDLLAVPVLHKIESIKANQRPSISGEDSPFLEKIEPNNQNRKTLSILKFR
jgi:hypothetical protein